MTKQLLNGWIDGSVEPRDGCEAVLDIGEGSRWHGFYKSAHKEWHCGITFLVSDVTRYFPIPPHDRVATTGASLLEVEQEEFGGDNVLEAKDV